MPMTGDVYPFTAQNVNNAPATAGVYALFINNVLIYIGRALGVTTTIRSRLQCHYCGSEGPCTQAATHYMRESCSNPATREKELLDEYLRLYGRLPKCNEVRV